VAQSPAVVTTCGNRDAAVSLGVPPLSEGLFQSFKEAKEIRPEALFASARVRDSLPLCRSSPNYAPLASGLVDL
jgi:hypothetical protein